MSAESVRRPGVYLKEQHVRGGRGDFYVAGGANKTHNGKGSRGKWARILVPPPNFVWVTRCDVSRGTEGKGHEMGLGEERRNLLGTYFFMFECCIFYIDLHKGGGIQCRIRYVYLRAFKLRSCAQRLLERTGLSSRSQNHILGNM